MNAFRGAKYGYLVLAVWIAIVVFVIMWLSGCSSKYMTYRDASFSASHTAFASLPDDPALHEIIVIESLIVHIVGSRLLFNWDDAKEAESGIGGYASSENVIWVFGKTVNGKIIVNEAVLGHELLHLLNWTNPKVANPDTLGELGL